MTIGWTWAQPTAYPQPCQRAQPVLLSYTTVGAIHESPSHIIPHVWGINRRLDKMS